MSDLIRVPPADLLGDGAFETLHLRPSGPWLLSLHLNRLARSAELLEMPPPALSNISDFPDSGGMRIVYTRHVLDISFFALSDVVLRERRDGVRVISTDTGVSIRRPPWSVSAAKSLSYASNFAARRWAVRQGADDMIWLSTEGYVLEAPTASVIWLTGDELCTVPPATAGILPGITAAHLLSLAPTVGLRPAERMITLGELAAADTIWLASSLRGLAEVTSLDGVPRARSPWTPRLLSLLGYSTTDA